MKQWLIYKHTSMKSLKSYVGITCKGMDHRWRQHVNLAFRQEDKNKNNYFHNAIRLYGAANWTHEVLLDSIDTLEEANSLEKYFIKKHDTFENGYNSTIGGDGTSGKIGKDHHLYGTKQSPETAKLSADKRYEIYLAKSDNEKLEWNNKKADSLRTLHGTEQVKLINVELGTIAIGFPNDILKKYTGNTNNRSEFTKLVQGKRELVLGWALYSVEGVYQRKQPSYTFTHPEHGTIESTLRSMEENYDGVNKSNLHAVTTGKRKSHRGWTYVPDSRTSYYNVKQEQVRFTIDIVKYSNNNDNNIGVAR